MAIRILRYLLLCVIFASGNLLANDNEFVIGPGDRILIKVYNEDDLNVRTKVGKAGLVRIPLIGDVLVTGKTPKALSAELEAAYLDGYLVEPSVSVEIEMFRPFYIRGAVQNPGSYGFELGLTVDQAIAVAGGLRDRASSDDWYIIREQDKVRTRTTKDTLVHPGDIIEIEESFF